MFNDNDKISVREAIFFLIATIIEAGTVMGARSMTREVGADAWLAQILTDLFTVPAIIITIKLGQRFYKHGFAEYSRIIVGSAVGWVLSVVLIVYWIFVSARMMNVVTSIVKQALLDKTPVIVISFSFMLLAVYICWYGIEPLCRVSLLIIIVALPLIIATSLTVIPKFKFDNFLPFLENGLLPVVKYSLKQVSDAEEMTFMLFLIPFMDKPKKAVNATLVMWVLLTIFSFVAKLIHIGVLGVEITKLRIMPSLASLEIAELPGSFIEKLGVVFSGFWIIMAFPTICGLLYAMSLTLSQMFHTRNHKPFLLPLITIIYIVSAIPRNALQAEKFYKFLTPLGIVVLVVIPLFLYVTSIIRGIKDG